VSTVLHRASERGVAEHGWLSSRFSFSFAEWYSPHRLGFGALRVINDDTIAPSSGFGMHPHRDMEIITIVTAGAVTHKDSEGNERVVAAGDVQVMSAGTGVLHSEYNNSSTEPLKLFQIWITPNKQNAPVQYAQKSFNFLEVSDGALPLVAPFGKGRAGELMINQDAWITYVDTKTKPLDYRLKQEGNGLYIFVIEGNCTVAGTKLSARDALGVSDTPSVSLSGEARALLIEVPMVV
jgi:quercetin 2,3-dioxygenase